ncbi:MAG: SOS response-associated peptidase [Nitriliruptoraceae bacterium]
MCGRYQSVSSPATLVDHFGVAEVRTEPLRERFNVAPSTDVYAIIDHGDVRALGTLRWGFVPRWAKRVGGTGQPVNARLETVATSRMFASSFARRRCLLPADGFYEWRDRGKGRAKQPYHLADPQGTPLAFAGIWTTWRDPESDEVTHSTAIVTTEARGTMTEIHHRMPVILPTTLWANWLTTSDDAPHLLDTVTALGPPRLTATPVTTRVNNVRNDGPELLEPGEVD